MEHYCGIIGVSDINVNDYIITNLNKLQHRGYQSAGISYVGNQNNEIITFKNLGLVEDVFKNFKFDSITNHCIAHVRYSTRKKNNDQIMLEEAQPLIGQIDNVKFALAHNGNIPTINAIKEEYKIDSTNNSDSYILVKLIEILYKKYGDMETVLKYIIDTVAGSYSIVILYNNNVYAIRDRFGIRPLLIGKRKNDGSGYCFVSESVALDNYKQLREVYPGEIIKSNGTNLITIYKSTKTNLSFCSFEYIYFMSSASDINSVKVSDVRYRLGYALGKTEKLSDMPSNSIILSVPTSSIYGAKGFADVTGYPYEEYILKNENVNRTFIIANEEERKIICEKKFYLLENKLINQNVYLIDDSIVRSTTCKTIIAKLKKAKVKSIHVRIFSPPVVSPCHFGIDFSVVTELIAHNKTLEEIRKELDVDSIRYLDVESMKNIFGHPVCTSCFTGKYNKELLDW